MNCPRCVRGGRLLYDALEARTFCILCGYAKYDHTRGATLEDDLALLGPRHQGPKHGKMSLN